MHLTAVALDFLMLLRINTLADAQNYTVILKFLNKSDQSRITGNTSKKCVSTTTANPVKRTLYLKEIKTDKINKRSQVSLKSV